MKDRRTQYWHTLCLRSNAVSDNFSAILILRTITTLIYQLVYNFRLHRLAIILTKYAIV